MPGYLGKTTNSQREMRGVAAQSEREAMWGNLTGTITAFDPVTQTATIQPDYKPIHGGKAVNMPELQEVPVRFPRAGGFIITAPIKAGDKVALRPQMRSSEEFHSGGDYQAVKDSRSMSLSDMEAYLDGGEPLSSPIEGFNATNFEIRSSDGSFAMEMSEDGKFRMRGAEGNWFDLLATLAELLAADGLAVLTGSSAGTGIHELQYRSQYADIAAKLRGMAL